MKTIVKLLKIYIVLNIALLGAGYLLVSSNTSSEVQNLKLSHDLLVSIKVDDYERIEQEKSNKKHRTLTAKLSFIISTHIVRVKRFFLDVYYNYTVLIIRNLLGQINSARAPPYFIN